jgi:hypothetical protein
MKIFDEWLEIEIGKASREIGYPDMESRRVAAYIDLYCGGLDGVRLSRLKDVVRDACEAIDFDGPECSRKVADRHWGTP